MNWSQVLDMRQDIVKAREEFDASQLLNSNSAQLKRVGASLDALIRVVEAIVQDTEADKEHD